MLAKAAVLCGGEGTRLRPLTRDRQKTMMEIGPNQRPLLEYIVRLLAYHGLTDITLLTGYKSEQIVKHFSFGSRFGVRLVYSKDTEAIRGSAQSLAQAIRSGKIGEFDELVIYYGDILSALNIRDLLEHHRSAAAAMTLVLTRDHRVQVGVAKVAGDRVVEFEEKPTLALNTTVGCLVISKDTVPILEAVTSGGGTDIMTHFVPAVISSGMKVSPFYMDCFWQDIGTIESFDKLDDALIEEKLKFLDSPT